MALLDPLLNKLIRKGRLTIVMPNGKARSFGPGGGDHFTVRVANRRTMFAIARNPRLGFGEAYMDGRVTIEDGDVLGLLRLVLGGNPWEALGGRRKAINKGKKRWRNLFRSNVAKRSRRNVAHHYDIGNELYRLFLDSDLQYSCAYFTDPANSLEQAQADKKAHIAAKLDLKPGQRVLDIGCGWGGLALYLHQKTGADVLGVTLSEEQLRVARERAAAAGVADKVQFELIDYRRVTGRFDRIVSVGMFEHVGPPHYRQFFNMVHDLLTDDGVALIHTIGRMGGPGTTDAFTQKYIFPGGYIPALSAIVTASEPFRLIATDIETLRLHYALTLSAWYARTLAHRAEIEALYDERFYRMWTFYLAGAATAFEDGGLCNYQLQFARDRLALPITRDYLGEAETAYRA